MPARNARSRHSRRAVLAGLVFIVLLQAAFLVLLALLQPYHADPDYLNRLAVLRQRLDESPGRPLCLVLGSSRMAMAFRPEQLPADPSGPLVFNGSHYGAGPVMNWLLLRRLHDAGVRPRWLVVEVLPGYLVHEREDFLARQVDPRDLGCLGSLASPKFWLLGTRFELERGPRAPLDLLGMEGSSVTGQQVGPLGGPVGLRGEASDTERQMMTASAGRLFERALADLHVSLAADRATRALLAHCRREGVRVVLLLTPEGTPFRRLYSPDAEATLNRYLDNLAAETGVGIVDAREWLPDEAFSDGHHVLASGAEQFTPRLAVEVIGPLVRGAVPSARRATAKATALAP